MDGNGRWAKLQGYGRTRGHHEGAKRVDEIVSECVRLGVRYLTLYAFSTENWLRPPYEVHMLMRLLVQQLKIIDKKLIRNQVQLIAQGSLSRLPRFVQLELNRVMRLTQFQQPKLRLTLCLSYGGRQEIVDAAREIAARVLQGELSVSEIDEMTFQQSLYQPNTPDPDLLIRTGGEYRVSNFLLWQIAYSEFYVTERFWPEFHACELGKAIEIYRSRKRRFGRTQEQIEHEKSLVPTTDLFTLESMDGRTEGVL
jgi:undecaprenyl diphosphate synthase